MPVLKPLHDEAGLVRLIAVDLPGGVRQRASPASRSWPSQVAAAGDKARELAYDGAAVDVPRAGEVRPHHRLQRAAAGRARSSTTARTRPTRSRSSATSRRKILGIPDLRVSGICVRVPVFTGHSLSINAEFARPLPVERARELLADAPGRRARPTSRPRCRRPARTRRTSAGSGRTRASTTSAGSRCSSATTTCARAPRSTPSRSPSWSPPRADPLPPGRFLYYSPSESLLSREVLHGDSSRPCPYPACCWRARRRSDSNTRARGCHRRSGPAAETDAGVPAVEARPGVWMLGGGLGLMLVGSRVLIVRRRRADAA